jgi:sulfur carrier protein
MKLTINGDARDVPEGLTVRGLLVFLELGGGPVAVEINREVVPRAEHEQRALHGEDVVEIVHLVGGG